MKIFLQVAETQVIASAYFNPDSNILWNKYNEQFFFTCVGDTDDLKHWYKLYVAPEKEACNSDSTAFTLPPPGGPITARERGRRTHGGEMQRHRGLIWQKAHIYEAFSETKDQIKIIKNEHNVAPIIRSKIWWSLSRLKAANLQPQPDKRPKSSLFSWARNSWRTWLVVLFFELMKVPVETTCIELLWVGHKFNVKLLFCIFQDKFWRLHREKKITLQFKHLHSPQFPLVGRYINKYTLLSIKRCFILQLWSRCNSTLHFGCIMTLFIGLTIFLHVGARIFVFQSLAVFSNKGLKWSCIWTFSFSKGVEILVHLTYFSVFWFLAQPTNQHTDLIPWTTRSVHSKSSNATILSSLLTQELQ